MLSSDSKKDCSYLLGGECSRLCKMVYAFVAALTMMFDVPHDMTLATSPFSGQFHSHIQFSLNIGFGLIQDPYEFQSWP